MSFATNLYVEPYDFGAALQLTPQERLDTCIAKVRADIAGYQALFDYPLIPPVGASDQELEALEAELGVPLPTDYRLLLKQWRYLQISGDGCSIWGLPYKGISFGGPWISEKHVPGRKFMVIGEYWRYADGDQLMFDLQDRGIPVVMWLHEAGPRVEHFAPSLSLAVWRLVYDE